ncbi:unnamed protein product [Rhizoctonia solani]|uniref:Uncharacterized protein n=1 Tax=Rhizoctonia solani TaxID=456999 RepID=A0A8H3E8A2_9AGAM|nr:unnamed protein product [Rhizoctonia solani]
MGDGIGLERPALHGFAESTTLFETTGPISVYLRSEMTTPTTPHEHTPNSDSAGLSHTMSFFPADSPPLDLHFPSRSHDSDSAGLDDFDTALFGHPNLVSLDSALGLQHPMLDPRRSILMSTPEHDILNTGVATMNDHHCTALRTQPGSQPRTMAGKHTDTSSPPLQLQFIIGPECSRMDNSPVHVPSAASLYQVVHPNVDDVIVNFDTKASSNLPDFRSPTYISIQSKSFPRRTKAQCANQIDPFAEHFLRHRLGDAKWLTFSSRLFERRLGATRNRTRSSRTRRLSDGSDTHETKSTGASAVDFLVKVEVVKEVLRTFVPHPYNPIKSLSHPYSEAPSGSVTLTRNTVLALSGWSNTQFSYWARRAEAVSVLASHDDRLRAVANALERRLHPNTKFPDSPIEEEHVTGKGLDAIVDDVKKRTGASQFLRGKHSSLDPFSTVSPGADSSSDDADDVTQSPVTPHIGISSSSYPLLCSPGSPFHPRQSLPGEAYSPISATCSSPSSSASPMFMLHDVDNLGLNGLGFGFEPGVGNSPVGLNSANAIGLNDEPKRDWPGLPLSDERGVKRAWDDMLQIGSGKRVRTEDENETGV